ncbi:MAG: type III-B CRISPR-associated protein Cas10/Cmr2 [Spirochaetales bacterium]|nr:type III-B CRISPR-associated protein Cas10/Cmr2 [Spirochaetales bacterium]
MEYAGITIGPIWDTIKNAKRTDALWAGSYIFSYLIEKILTAIEGAGVDKNKVLIPCHDEKSVETQAGLYPDRIIFHADTIHLSEIKQIIHTILEKFADDIGEFLNKCGKKIDCTAIRTFISNYFKVYAVKTTVPKEDNPVLEINKYLDSLELYNTNVQPVRDTENYLSYFLEHVRGSFLLGKEKRIRSITEISAGSLIERNADLQEIAAGKNFDTLEKGIKELLLNRETKRHLGYIAVVMADGDNMGNTIASLSQTDTANNRGSDNPYRDFSKALHASAQKFVQEITDFGGEPVYAGGDDLLFFAPLLSKDGEKTIFRLIEQFAPVNPGGGLPHIPSISFGVSITYHKFPLYEALQAARDLLKKSKAGQKNTVSVRLLTHSGSAFEVSFYKGGGNNPYSKFLHLLETNIDDTGYLSSVRQKILKSQKIIETAGKNRELMTNFFENEFNEDVHNRHRDYLNSIMEYIDSLYQANNQDVIKRTAAALKLIELYRQKGKE